MSFATGLSGLRAATADLNTTGHNIANASTVGFKRSRAEFGDVYAASLGDSGAQVIGSGVLLQKVAQQFDQGTITYTQRSLDVAINGRGFFILDNDGARTYSRAGIFGIDKDGYVTHNNGGTLVGYAADENGDIDLGNETRLRIEAFNLPPNQTTNVEIGVNLDATLPAPDPTQYPNFDPDDQNTYNHASSLTVYDSEGIPHIATMYFRKDQPDPATIGTDVHNDWFVYVEIDGELVNNQGTVDPGTGEAPVDIGGTDTYYAFPLKFNELGQMDNVAGNGQFLIEDWIPATQIQTVSGSNAEPAGPGTTAGVLDENTSEFLIDLRGSTQFGDEFNIDFIRQDGYGPGNLVGTEIAENGTLFARYTNGQALTLGQILLADFPNPQGLTPLGDTTWGESFTSGPPVPGLATTGAFGALNSGALEDSNVDISEELVNLILAQRNFQSNAKTIETNNAITQTIINLR